MTTIKLPAIALAYAWQNVSLAAAQDKGAMPGLYRTVQVEVHSPSSVRLTASDGILLFTSWVATDEEPDPGIGVKGQQSFLVRDTNKTAAAFMGLLTRVASPDVESEDYREVTVQLVESTHPDHPALEGMAGQVCRMTTDEMTVDLDVLDAPFLSWHERWPTPDRQAPVERISFGVEQLAQFGKLKAVTGGVRMTFHTANGAVAFQVDGSYPVTGLMIPRKPSTSQETADQIDMLSALWNAPTVDPEANSGDDDA